MINSYLFDSDFQPRIASVFVDGKKISKEEEKVKMDLREFIQILLVLILSFILFLFLKK